MATDAPNSHKDPYWSDLSSATEEKLGLPTGLLSSIVTKGERSNNDQVSEAGAKTPFQIIPATRKAAIEKYGIDPYLSPENAAEVAGHLLKDSLDRNGGDVAQAVAEYHGGTDRTNWGSKTKAYVNRVMSGQRAGEQAADPQQSTFSRLQAAQTPPNSNAIANVYQAYQSGQMSPQEKADFESDVKSGAVMLPHGATLAGQQALSPTGKPAPQILPAAITDAYQQGKMSEQERTDLESDIKSGLVQLAPTPNTLPDFQNGKIVPDQPGIQQHVQDPTLAQNIGGAAGTTMALGTGATTGTIGMIGGTLKGLAEQLLSGQFGTQQAADAVERSAMQGQDALTYSPRTPAGQQQVQAIGETLAPLAAATPFAAELGTISQGVKAAVPLARGAIAEAAAPVTNAASKITEAVRPAAADVQAGIRPGMPQSGGAAAVEAGTLRQAKANNLPVPIDLTEGQKTRDFSQQRFERETAKDPEMGQPIRDRFADQNMRLQQNFDAFLDQTGAEAPDLRSAGQSVDTALRARAANDKTKIRSLYKEADKSGEMQDPVSLDGFINHLNDSSAEATTAPLINTARQLAIKMGIAKDENGTLVPVKEKPQPFDNLMNKQQQEPVNLKTAETLRQAINRNTDTEPTNIRQATIMKGLIDEATDGAGGEAYRKARAARTQYAKDYENVGLVKNLVGQKQGTADRAIALEDVVRRSVIDPGTSLDDVRQVRRLLQTEGVNGQQAWKELQGATLNYLKDEALKNVARDQKGNAIVSPAQLDRAISKLDKNGKLDFVFGKKGADQLRTINDVAKDILVAPPGAVNNSNTASVLAALMDVAISGMTGIPAPLMTSYRLLTKKIKDTKTRARVNKALGLNPKEEI